MTEPITRNSWKNLQELPELRVPLSFEQIYSSEEFAKIQRGFRPFQMEDKWFIFYDHPWLHIHRSWTGYRIYSIRFSPLHDGVETIESWVNRDPDQYYETSIGWDREQVKILVQQLLIDYMKPQF